MVEPRVPELPDQLIDLGLVATAARTLDVMHPAQSPGSHQIGNHGDHRTLTVKDADRTLAEASPDTQFAAAVASQAMLLRGSPNLGTIRWEETLRLAERGVGPDREGYRSEFVDLVRRTAQLAPQSQPRPGQGE